MDIVEDVIDMGGDRHGLRGDVYGRVVGEVMDMVPSFFLQCKDLENIWYSITPLRCGDNVFTAKHVACVDEDWIPYQLHLAFKYDERPNVPLRVGKLIKRYFGAIPTQPLPVQLGGAAARCRQ